MDYISADDFRVNGEKAVLYLSVFLFLIAILLLVGMTAGLIFLPIVFSIILVKIKQGQLLGQSIKVSENQLPEVYEIAKTAARRLCMKVPDIFITQDPKINAYAIGFLSKNSIVLNSATVESMSREELLAIIGHEATHIKACHTNWLVITTSTNSIQIPFFSQIFGFIFLFWSRKAEYTSDRGALLACRESKAVITALAKVAIGKRLFEKLNIGNLSNQKMDLDKNQIAKLSETLLGHPFIINRIHDIQTFYSSTKYSHLVNSPQAKVHERQTNKTWLRESKKRRGFTKIWALLCKMKESFTRILKEQLSHF